MSRVSVAVLALDLMLLVTSRCGTKGVQKSFRARARQEVSNIAFSGLPLTIAVIASRSSAAALEEALRDMDPGDFIGRVCSDIKYASDLNLKEDEDKAYAIYGFSLLYALKALGAIKERTLAEFIKGVASSPLVQAMALEVATWIKRFAEAYIHEAG